MTGVIRKVNSKKPKDDRDSWGRCWRPTSNRPTARAIDASRVDKGRAFDHPMIAPAAWSGFRAAHFAWDLTGTHPEAPKPPGLRSAASDRPGR